MRALEAIDGRVVAAILAMAVATYLSRAGGFWLMGHVRITPRVRRMLDALPGALVAALVVPLAVRSGPAAMLALAAAAGVMIASRNEFLAVAAGVAVAAGLRAAF
jgi:uncharacterized membrane protein